MAKMTMRTSGEIAREVRITAEEIKAIIRDKFHDIPDDAEMAVAIDGISEDVKTVTFSWTSRTDDSKEIELVPSPPTCRRQCRTGAERTLHALPLTASKLGEIAEREKRE